MNGSDEVPLTGGRTSTGVVRVGETVRKPATENSTYVRLLLKHLAVKAFDGAPRYLGEDDRGRDVFSFVPGDVPLELGFHDAPTLRHAARLIRRFHDATAGAAPPLTSASGSDEVACHNDLSPCNFVFRDDVPVAIIDYDAAAPGDRNHDLGYAAWLWLDLGTDTLSASEQANRLRVFLAAYGDVEAVPVLRATIARQSQLIDEGRNNADDALVKWATACLEWTQDNFDVLASSGTVT